MPRLYTRSDSPVWYAEIEADGIRQRVSTGVPVGKQNRRKAEEAARERETAFVAERARTRAVSVEYAAERLLAYGELKPTTCDGYEILLERVTSEGPLLTDITLEWIKDYVRRRRVRGASDVVIRRELSALSSTMEYAIDRDMPGAPAINPCKQFRRKSLKDAVKKPRWLLPEQVRNILNAAEPKFWRPFLSVVLDTGMRHEEVLGLTWAEIDLANRVINLDWRREKAGRGRVIPMSHAVFSILSATPRRDDCPHVFVNPKTGKRYTSIQSTWRRLRAKAGEPTARIHDLRHTFSSWARQSGMSKEDRKDIVGHADDVTHAGYAHASIETLKEAMRNHSPLAILERSPATEAPCDYETVADIQSRTGLSEALVRYKLRHGLIEGVLVYGANPYQAIGCKTLPVSRNEQMTRASRAG